MSRDLLLLLEPGFADPRYPGERFSCPDGAPIEGLLASDPSRVERLDVKRLPFERPREVVVDMLDAEHQGLPVLDDDQPAPMHRRWASGASLPTRAAFSNCSSSGTVFRRCIDLRIR